MVISWYNGPYLVTAIVGVSVHWSPHYRWQVNRAQEWDIEMSPLWPGRWQQDQDQLGGKGGYCGIGLAWLKLGMHSYPENETKDEVKLNIYSCCWVLHQRISLLRWYIVHMNPKVVFDYKFDVWNFLSTYSFFTFVNFNYSFQKRSGYIMAIGFE